MAVTMLVKVLGIVALANAVAVVVPDDAFIVLIVLRGMSNSAEVCWDVRGEALAADVPADFRAVGHPTKHYADDEFVTHRHAAADHGDLHGGGGVRVRVHHLNPGEAVLKAIPLYFWNFAPHPFKPAPGGSPLAWFADVPMWAFLLLLELIGAVIKPFALMVRLFANMIAGHIVLASLIILIPVTSTALVQIGIGPEH